MPYVYTEQGIIALAGVLHSGLADEMAVEISRVIAHLNFVFLTVAEKHLGYHFHCVYGLLIRDGNCVLPHK